MRELKVVGLDADGKNVICQGGSPDDQFKVPVDDRLRAAIRGEAPALEQPQLDIEVTDLLSPKEIQARIRAGASVEQVATASGSDISRIRRFAHPVLLERSRAAELATVVRLLDERQETIDERTRWAQTEAARREQLERQLAMVRDSRWVKLGRQLRVGPEIEQS